MTTRPTTLRSTTSTTSTTLRHGRLHVAIPGPSIIPERVLAAMQRPMPNIYEGPLVDVSSSLFADLPKIARTEGEAFIVIGNGHAAWQMAVSNTMRRGRKVLVLESGRFAVVWGEQAALSGVDVEVLPGAVDGPVDPGAVEDRLRADVDRGIEAVLVVLTDTASSVRNDIPAIRRAIDSARHPALLMVDAIASLACEPFEMDEWGVDVTVAASQKGLMTPPGIAFVWANDKALAAHERADMRVGYFDWESRLDVDAHYQLYNGTPPISHLYALREALDMIFEEGLENTWRRHEVLARSVWAAVDAWGGGRSDGLSCGIATVECRSHAVTTVRTGSVDATRLREVCEDQAGLTLGLGIGADVDRQFRIGHMGHLNPPMLLGTLGTIEAGLHSLGATIGSSGVAAAARVIGDAFA
ncbi:MAG: aminotransferase class V-fold PLP-dependent enzyme [Ilumatobacter sp.]|uniref:pyridoxal-phosphate-dependent aminotransferase family protein n=1 Tax=Ilumatobacter sp. TaxID=1967498 RepID=UPI003297AEB0